MWISTCFFFFFFSSRRRHTRSLCDWSSDVCSSDLIADLDLRKFHQLGYTDRARRKIEIPAKRENASCHVCNFLYGRSEERRVGKECRFRWWREHEKKKKRVEKNQG